METRMLKEVVDDVLGSTFVLKQKQESMLISAAKGNHTMGILPTGYGKSLIYALHAPLLNKLNPQKTHITLVVSPLKSLMLDQVRRWKNLGIRTAAILGHSGHDMDRETENDLMNGGTDLVFTSPEAILSPKWWQWVRKFQNRISLLVLDEVHCFTKWGLTFREEYLRTTSLTSRLACPIMLLTATATNRMVTEILQNLNLRREEVEIFAAIPNRPNIHLSVVPVKDKFEAIGWYLDELKEKGVDAAKTIIYARQIDHVAELYTWLNESLAESAHAPGPGQSCSVESRLIEMYHASTDSKSQERICRNFSTEGSKLRCVVATIAFGLGVDIADIDQVIHWGCPSDVLCYWQETGRCARDGRPGKAIMYLPPFSVNKRWVDEDMRDLVQSSRCIRKSVLNTLFVHGMEKDNVQVMSCCSVCDSAK